MALKHQNRYFKISSGFGVGEAELLQKTKQNSKDRSEVKGCDVSCSGSCTEYSPRKYIRNLYKHFYEAYKKGEFVDAMLYTEDGGFYPVHRIVLCGESEYFRALFTSGVNPTEQTDIQLRNVSNESLEMAINFMYTFKACLNNDNAIKILKTADYLGIIALKHLCCDFISKNIDPTNVIGIYQFAKDHFCKDLEAQAYKYIMKNFTEISQRSNEILDLSMNNIVSIFGNEELNVRSEETVWLAGLRWIEHCPRERKNHFLEIIKQIRTGLMNPKFVVEYVKDHPLVVENESVQSLINQTTKFHDDLQIKYNSRDLAIQRITHSWLAKPRLPGEIVFAVGGRTGAAAINSIEVYDARADRWKSLPKEHLDSKPRMYMGAATIGFEIILIGGFDGITYFSTVRGFNVVTKKWRNLAPMTQQRCYVAVAKLDNHIYAFGGFNGRRRLDTCERYDPEKNQWDPLRSMNSPRSDASATAHDGKIYVCGGFSGIQCLMSAEMFDPITNQWTSIAPMLHRRSGVSCMSYHGSIYALGGFNGSVRLCCAEKYNPATNSWSLIPNMYNSRSNFGCVVIDDMLFAVGGFIGYSAIRNAEFYDDRSNKWYEASDLKICRSALTCSVVSDLPLPNIQEYIHENREFTVEKLQHRHLINEHHGQNKFVPEELEAAALLEL